MMQRLQARRPAPRVHRLSARETLVSYGFLAPALVFFAGFVLVPMVMGVYTSFFKYTMKEFTFAGLDNYIRLFADDKYLKSLGNTVILVVGVVPVVCAFSLWVGALIYGRSSGVRSFFRGVFYLPVVTGTVSVTVVWKWIYDNYNGILNYLLKSAGLIDRNIAWLGTMPYAMWAILIVLFTTSVGQPIVLYIAALGNVDKSLIEAAEVDGASNLQVFWRIKWPSVMPTTLYVVVLTTINSFQCFSLIQLLTNGGPNYGTSTVMFMLYNTSFKFYEYGYANAMGVVLAVIIGLFSVLQFKAFSSDVEY